MKAAVWHGRKDLRVEDIPEPHPAPGQVKLQVGRVGICGTDLHEYLAGPIFVSTSPHPLTGTKAPVALGHEFCGTVVEVGKGVKKVNVGDRVSAAAFIICGECWYCRRGHYALCDQLGVTGLSTHGAMAEYVVVPEYALFKLPESISDDIGALVEPMATGVRAMLRTRVRPGETVAVLGAGPIGLGTIMAARAVGASRVYAIEKATLRKEVATAVGATAVFDPNDGDPLEWLQDLTSGRGVDVAFECIGLKETIPLALTFARKGGRVGIVGVSEEPTTIDFEKEVLEKEKEIIAVLGYVEEPAIVIDLITDGRMNPTPLITDTIGLDEVVNKGFEELINKKDNHIKILISPQG